MKNVKSLPIEKSNYVYVRPNFLKTSFKKKKISDFLFYLFFFYSGKKIINFLFYVSIG
jgi:hypothetical protein